MSGTSFKFDETCPAMTTVGWSYTASATTLQLFGGNVELDFVLP